MINLVIFDLWNTLCYKKYKKGNVRGLIKELNANIKYRKVSKTYENFFQLDSSADFEKKYRDMLKELKLYADDKTIKKYAKLRRKIETHCFSYSYTLPIIKKLKQKGYKIAVISNTTHLAASRAIIKSGLDKYVDRFFLSYNERLIKPDPRFFKRVLKYFKVKPSEAIMIGDTYLDDIVPARKLGINTIHLKDRIQIKSALKRKGIL
ncbi:HAD-IA family hydrolase [Candidatus Woesearchaeota archaeon]|nr:HAD-IA family hydrolase [Candidatus Woesearchaeota archaeon]